MTQCDERHDEMKGPLVDCRLTGSLHMQQVSWDQSKM